MPIYQLNIEAEDDFELIGISSHQRDYRLVWSLNRQMQWKMKREDDFLIDRNGQRLPFARFVFVLPHEQTILTLLANKNEHGLLMTELPQFDYLLKASNAPRPLNEAFFKKLKSTPLLITAFPLAADKMKNRHLLLAD